MLLLVELPLLVAFSVVLASKDVPGSPGQLL
jgi:hypothetical protein